VRETKLILVLLAVLTFLAAGFVLWLLEPILQPFVVAVFLSQIFHPLMGALRRRRVPSALAILLVLVVVSAVLVVFSWILYASAESFAEALPRYQERLSGILEGASQRLVTAVPRLRGPIERWRWEEAIELSSAAAVVAAGLGSFLVFFNDLFLILLFVVFLLAGSHSFPDKLNRAFAAQYAQRVGAVMRNIEGEMRRYLLTKTLVNLGHGALVAALLAALGVDFPLLWGFLTFIAHYIPNLGALLSVGLPAVFFFLQFDSPGWALLVTLLNAALQFVIGNVVEPRIMGTSLDLSPLLVLLSLIFWGWLWGPWGMVLAIPITSTIKIVCANVAPLRPLAVLMSDSAVIPGEPDATEEAPASAPADSAVSSYQQGA
jgi:predicted PurR-regulated permease PerM